MKYEWSDGFSVGVREIDKQHEQFVSILKKLQNAATKGEDMKGIDAILIELTKYTKQHFDTEEKYMKDFDYNGLEEHKSEHNKMLNRVYRFSSHRTKSDTNVLALKLSDFLEDWLIQHIASMDKEYVSCFKENGLK